MAVYEYIKYRYIYMLLLHTANECPLNVTHWAFEAFLTQLGIVRYTGLPHLGTIQFAAVYTG